MSAAVITGSVVMSATGAFYLLTDQHHAHARIFIRIGVIAGAIASCLMMFPLGDGQARNVDAYQPVTLSAMEGSFIPKRVRHSRSWDNLTWKPRSSTIRLSSPMS
jgi:cytochrome bd ubiquinol oxidase subunit I